MTAICIAGVDLVSGTHGEAHGGENEACGTTETEWRTSADTAFTPGIQGVHG